MGQKVHPVGIRLGITKEWSSRWYANSQTFPIYVEQDHRVREFLRKKLKEASISRIHIERPAKKANITIHTARPGVVIGKKGEDIEKLRGEVAKLLGDAAARRAAQHRRDPQAGARCAARGRRHRPAARAPRAVPPRHAPRRDEHDAHRRRRHQGAGVGPLERRRDRALGVVPRRPRAAAHAPRGHRLRVGRGAHDVRRDRREGLGFPRRSARSAPAEQTTNAEPAEAAAVRTQA